MPRVDQYNLVIDVRRQQEHSPESFSHECPLCGQLIWYNLDEEFVVNEAKIHLKNQHRVTLRFNVVKEMKDA